MIKINKMRIDSHQHFWKYHPVKNSWIEDHMKVIRRDFLHDALRTRITGVRSSIYGFIYDVKTHPPIDLKRTRMLVKKSGVKKEEYATILANMKRAKKIINHFEDLAGVSKTKLEEIADVKGIPVYLFTGPPFWQKSPQLISLFTFLIRLGVKNITFKDEESMKKALEEVSVKPADRDNDTAYLKTCYDKLHIVIKNWKVLFSNKDKDIIFPKTLGIGTFHNQAGIVSLCRFISPTKPMNDKLKSLLAAESKNANKTSKRKEAGKEKTN